MRTTRPLHRISSCYHRWPSRSLLDSCCDYGQLRVQGSNTHLSICSQFAQWILLLFPIHCLLSELCLFASIVMPIRSVLEATKTWQARSTCNKWLVKIRQLHWIRRFKAHYWFVRTLSELRQVLSCLKVFDLGHETCCVFCLEGFLDCCFCLLVVRVRLRWHCLCFALWDWLFLLFRNSTLFTFGVGCLFFCLRNGICYWSSRANWVLVVLLETATTHFFRLNNVTALSHWRHDIVRGRVCVELCLNRMRLLSLETLWS